MNSVAIIGGGITGLTAAFRLRQRSVPVTLYEASPRAGGVIQSVQADGYLAEFGPNTILETSPKIASLIRDVGLEGERLYSDPRAGKRFLVRRRQPVELPGSPVQFFTSPLFGWGAKLRLMAEPFLAPSPADLEESLAEFVVRRLGREFLDYAINPFVAGVYAGDPAKLSVKHAFPKLHEVEQRYGSLIKGQFLGAKERKRRGEVSKQNAPKVSFKAGLQTLTDALQRALGDSIRLQHQVDRAEQRATGWHLTVTSPAGVRLEEHAAVLVAVPTHRFPEIHTQQRGTEILSVLREVVYPPVASIVLGFRRGDVKHPLDGFGVLVPEIEGFRILGTLFSSSLFPHRAPDGFVTLTSYVGGTRDPELALAPADKLFEITTRDLEVLLGVTGAPTFRHHRLYPRAIPQYNVGYGRFKSAMHEAEASAPGLFLAGHYREGISLGDSLVSGHDVAERIAGYCAGGATLPRGPLTAGQAHP